MKPFRCYIGQVHQLTIHRWYTDVWGKPRKSKKAGVCEEACESELLEELLPVRGEVKYYFADFVR